MFYKIKIYTICFAVALITMFSPSIAATNNNSDQDAISSKQTQILDTAVLVRTFNGTGSGIIIDRLCTDTEDMFEYYVLTNAHVTQRRLLRSVDSLTGKIRVKSVNTNCTIGILDRDKLEWEFYTAESVSEDIVYDLAVLSFRSKKELFVAKMASSEMLKQVRIFDEVFVVGCPYGKAPIPTVGIISTTEEETRGQKERIIYIHTAQIVPGYSGGGLFKKYGTHYYMIGVPYKVLIAHNGQMLPHIAHSISVETVNKFFNESMATTP